MLHCFMVQKRGEEYLCGTWRHRKAIKITFSMNGKTPNEIVLLETGLTELKAEIYKRGNTCFGKRY